MKNQPHKENKKIRELWAILLLLISLFVAVCFYMPNSTGIVGKIIVNSMVFLIGSNGLKFLPVFLLMSSVSLFSTSVNQNTVIQASVIGLFCLILSIDSAHFKLGNTLPSTLKPNSGGWVGILSLYVLHKLIGPTGVLIFIVGGSCIFCMLIFGFSLSGLVKKIFYPPITDTVNQQASGLEHRTISLTSKIKKWLLGHDQNTLVFPYKESAQENDFSQNPANHPQHPLTKPTLFHDSFEEISTPEIVEKRYEEEIKDNSLKKLAKRKTLFKLPSLNLLKEISRKNFKDSTKEKQEKAAILEEALSSFNVHATVVHITQGPSVTRFELQPGEGVKISKITALSKDIALKLAVHDVRIEAPIPGKALVGIEVPNNFVDMVGLKALINTPTSKNHPSKLLAGMGLTITGEHVLMDLSRMPHILIAGATGSGKSVCVNTIILSILMRARPDEVKFLMIDPKKVELSFYQDIPHLVAPVVTDPHKAAATLKRWALFEMEQRYDLFSKSGVKDIEGYNRLIEKEEETDLSPIPYIVVVIDELADLMMVASQEVEQTICRLAQMARATGIHLVIATQRPSVNVVTGLIKANVPSRISFFLQSQIDSRTILDMPGAEKLLGKGDMLYLPVGSFKPKRVQGVFISEQEIKDVVQFLKQQGEPDYIEEILNVEPLESLSENSVDPQQDALFEEAKNLVMNTQYASTSYLQRKLRIGYNRAARIMDELEEKGIISQYAGEKKPRSIS
jgi:S-DNA-T family DNA segregation ATPase FtsK/SpoIIIE